MFQTWFVDEVVNQVNADARYSNAIPRWCRSTVCIELQGEVETADYFFGSEGSPQLRRTIASQPPNVIHHSARGVVSLWPIDNSTLKPMCPRNCDYNAHQNDESNHGKDE